jgi:invasion protein IalB
MNQNCKFLLALSVAAVAASTSAMAQSKKSEATKSAAAQPAQKDAAAAIGGGTQPLLLGQYGDWGAYTASPGGRKICFALAKPAKGATEPANRPRDPAYMFISTRPAEKVSNEVSVIVGYGQKPSADALVEIGSARYAMYTQNDGAWIKNAAEENKLIDSLRKGADVVVKGESAKGTKTTDTYALKGLAQALDRVGQECK